MRSKRTPEARAVILAVLGLGHFRGVAAQKAGIAPQTLSDWIASDEGFRLEVERAEADEEIRLLAKVREGAREDPRLALALLERRFRERWGRQAPAGSTGKDEGGAAGGGSGAREVPFGFEG